MSRLPDQIRGASRIPAEWVETITAACPVDQQTLAAGLLRVLARRATRAARWSQSVLAQLPEQS
jgi:hypothetical protein